MACASTTKQAVVETPEMLELQTKQAENQKRFERALMHQKNEEYTAAKVIYKSLLAEDKSLISPLVNLGVIALKQNKLKEAKIHFDAVLATEPNNLRVLNYLAYIARDSGEFDAAEGHYRKILEIEPNNVIAIRNLGVLLDLYRGRLAEALALYETYQSLMAEPDAKVKDWIFDTKSRLKAKQK